MDFRLYILVRTPTCLVAFDHLTWRQVLTGDPIFHFRYTLTLLSWSAVGLGCDPSTEDALDIGSAVFLCEPGSGRADFREYDPWRIVISFKSTALEVVHTPRSRQRKRWSFHLYGLKKHLTFRRTIIAFRARDHTIRSIDSLFATRLSISLQVFTILVHSTPAPSGLRNRSSQGLQHISYSREGAFEGPWAHLPVREGSDCVVFNHQVRCTTISYSSILSFPYLPVRDYSFNFQRCSVRQRNTSLWEIL